MKLSKFDASYMERLRHGDQTTTEHFIGYFGDLILLRLRSRLQSAQAIEHVRSETLSLVLSLLKNGQASVDAEQPGSLVHSACSSVLSEYHSSKCKSGVLKDTSPTPERMVSSALAASVQDILHKLSEVDRDALRAGFVRAKEESELLQNIGISRDYVRMIVHRCKNSLRTMLAHPATQTAPMSATKAHIRKSLIFRGQVRPDLALRLESRQ